MPYCLSQQTRHHRRGPWPGSDQQPGSNTSRAARVVDVPLGILACGRGLPSRSPGGEVTVGSRDLKLAQPSGKLPQTEIQNAGFHVKVRVQLQYKLAIRNIKTTKSRPAAQNVVGWR